MVATPIFQAHITLMLMPIRECILQTDQCFGPVHDCIILNAHRIQI